MRRLGLMPVLRIFFLHLESSLKFSLPTLRLHCSQAWAGALHTPLGPYCYWRRWAWTAEGARLRIPPCQACWPEGSGPQVKNLATEPARFGPMCSWLESKMCHGLAT